MDSYNIASHLPAMAQQQPDTLAVITQHGIDGYSHHTYQQLDEASDQVARGLQEIGISKGVRTVLMVKPGPEFFALVFALFKVGAVMVAVDPGIGIKNLRKCLDEAEPEAFIGIPAAHIARLLFGWARKTIRTKVNVGPSFVFGKDMTSYSTLLQLGTSSEKQAMVNTASEDIAAILFTSGSTGTPKGVVYTHANFNAQICALKELYQIQPGEIDVATFPLFALFAPALGMISIIPDMDFTRPGHVDPRKIFAAAEKYKATTMFGSPALLDRVGRWGVENHKRLPTLKRVLSAGAPVPAIVMQRYAQMLETGVQIFTPYGATESLPVSSIGSDEILNETSKDTENGKGICVGRPVNGLDVRIIRIKDEPIINWTEELLMPTNEIGEIIVKGPQVTAFYYNRPRSTELAKIPDSNGGFFHRMGDTGYFDDQGRLWFCGRMGQRVITGEGVLFTVPCEGVFNVHPKVFRTALVGIKRNGKTIPVLCIELEANERGADHDVISEELKQSGSKFEHTREIKNFLFHKSFPVDIRHNAKIGREKLTIWAQKKLS
jgi:acyl-CoA synthetase (AMP-forming)/AMP-acid ligase II